MYKCGWNGCEKAYGTLNHLNAHVTMQSHGQKRTPEGMLTSLLLAVAAMNATPSPHPHTAVRWLVGWLFGSYSIVYGFDFKPGNCLLASLVVSLRDGFPLAFKLNWRDPHPIRSKHGSTKTSGLFL
jgi:hypothetical protein